MPEVLKYLDDYRDILKCVTLKCIIIIIILCIDESINNIETTTPNKPVAVKTSQSKIQV